ncbi:hypothetical protein U1Q18_044197 [Sarracenia purpurea var. burkii]
MECEWWPSVCDIDDKSVKELRVEDSFHLLYECPQLEGIRSEYTRDFDPSAPHPDLDLEAFIQRLTSEDEPNINLETSTLRFDEDIEQDPDDSNEKRLRGAPDHPMLLNLTMGKFKHRAIVDSGCSHFLFNDRVYERMKELNPYLAKTEIPCRGASAGFSQAVGKKKAKALLTAILKFAFTDHSKPQVFQIPIVVVQDLNVDILIGRTVIEDLGFIIDHPRYRIVLEDRVTRELSVVPYVRDVEIGLIQLNFDESALLECNNINLSGSTSESDPATTPEPIADSKPEIEAKKAAENDPVAEILNRDCSKRLTAEERAQLAAILRKHIRAFRNKIGRCNAYTHKFKFKRRPELLKCKYRRRRIPKKPKLTRSSSNGYETI